MSEKELLKVLEIIVENDVCVSQQRLEKLKKIIEKAESEAGK